VERVGVGLARQIEIVPDDKVAGLGRDADAGTLEEGLAAGLDIVEAAHRGPRPLPADLLLIRPIWLVRPEEIVMLLELLADGVALPLQRLGIFARQAQEVRDAGIKRGDERIGRFRSQVWLVRNSGSGSSASRRDGWRSASIRSISASHSAAERKLRAT
jgi:hypothetical protein